jgi:DNA-binding NarL/FixJ family response regulator
MRTHSPQVAAQMFKAGADGFVTKDCEPEVLINAIRKVAARGHYLDPDFATEMAFDSGTPSQYEPHLHL